MILFQRDKGGHMIYRGRKISFKKGVLKGKGGNSFVYRIYCSQDERELVAKFLKRNYSEKTIKRFENEINATIKLSKNTESILPVVDYYLAKPNKNNKDKSWYVMPYAKTLEDSIFGNRMGILDKIDVLIEIAKIIEYIHEKGYSHRDIKMGNLLIYNNKIVLSDFGLVSHEEIERVTEIYEKIGPWNTIAPEMKRDALHVKYCQPADVYSFGKLFWIILTENNDCFEGQYEKNKVFALKKEDYDVDSIEVLHKLLNMTTSDDISKRPNMSDVIRLIKEWKSIISDIRKLKREQREVINKKIYNGIIAGERIYSDVNQIYRILCELLGFYMLRGQQFNDISLLSCKRSIEIGCLEISDENIIYIIKPTRFSVIREGGIDKYILEIADITNGAEFSLKGLYYGELTLNENEKIRTKKDKNIIFIPIDK